MGPYQTFFIPLFLSADMGDPTIAPDGVKCGHFKMCINNRCVALKNSTTTGEEDRKTATATTSTINPDSTVNPTSTKQKNRRKRKNRSKNRRKTKNRKSQKSQRDAKPSLRIREILEGFKDVLGQIGNLIRRFHRDI